MISYTKLVDESFKNKTSALIYNSSREHAKLLVKKLIESASRDIMLYTSGVDFEFYNDQEISDILKGKTGLNVRILLDDEACGADFKKMFKKAEISVLNKSEDLRVMLSEAINDMDYRFVKHFMVVDGEAFRVELPHGEDTTNVSAVACANNAKIANELQRVFEKIKVKYAA